MDNAQDLLSFGGLQVVINGLNSTEALVKEYAAFVLGAAFSRWAVRMDVPLARTVWAPQVKSSFTLGMTGLQVTLELIPVPIYISVSSRWNE